MNGWLIAGGIVGGLGGTAGILSAVARFFEKLALQKDRQRFQKERDEDKARFEREMAGFRERSASLLEKRRIEGAKEAFEHQLRFQKQFEEYGRLWSALIGAQDAASDFRVWVYHRCQKDEDRAKREDARARLKGSLDSIENLARENQPVYSTEVITATWDALNKLRDLELLQPSPLEHDLSIMEQAKSAFWEAHRLLMRVSDLMRTGFTAGKGQSDLEGNDVGES